MAKAVHKTETVTKTTVTLEMTAEEALAVYTLVSSAEELPEDHPLTKTSRTVFYALLDPIEVCTDYEDRLNVYKATDVVDSR